MLVYAGASEVDESGRERVAQLERQLQLQLQGRYAHKSRVRRQKHT